MTERIELNELEMEDVVGGMFHYQYNSKGDYFCMVDGLGVYGAAENAKRKINLYNAENPGASDEELVNWAKANGYLWDI